jgi:2-oxoglutarate dehydrogenase E2 component (dihydrolipoamide succinyltransferase)
MKKNIVAPSVGESITEVSILKWHKKNGQAVKTGDLLLEIESDKATVEIVAETNGVLQTLKNEGDRIPIGELIATIDDAGTATVAASAPAATTTAAPAAKGAAPAAAAAPAGVPMSAAPAAAAAPAGVPMSAAPARTAAPASAGMGPAARKLATESGVDTNQINGTGRDGRVTKGDVIQAGSAPRATTTAAPAPTAAPVSTYQERPGDKRVPMSMLRQRIAQRLVEAQHTAAILTTFNEVDMGPIMEIRAKNKDAFKAKNGVNLGFMGFFAKACIAAFKTVPEVNASIDGRDTIYRDYVDMGIAVGTDRGLVVPVLREAHLMSNIAIEKKIGELALKARDGKLSIADLSGGTFTITNGGTYGSLMSTPILNPPQAAILGMHKIQDRPMAIDGKVVIRPMMYLALSYDHRLIDGKGAVTFLVTVKDLLEHPEKLGMEY